MTGHKPRICLTAGSKFALSQRNLMPAEHKEMSQYRVAHCLISSSAAAGKMIHAACVIKDQNITKRACYPIGGSADITKRACYPVGGSAAECELSICLLSINHDKEIFFTELLTTLPIIC
jgi:hypothetical protein